MVTPRRYLVVGLPASGKTTFIAALWHVVQANEIASALCLHRMDGDRTYLNELRDAWVQCTRMVRTSPHGKLVRMLLIDEGSAVSELWLPDMLGEIFSEHWARREWATNYAELVDNADGLLLFVRPEAVVEPLSLAVANRLVSDLGVAADESAGEKPKAPSIASPWNANRSPTQVQLVDLLQVLLWRRPDVRWRIAIVVSAWDEVKIAKQRPDEWCRSRLPLLDQFVRAHAGRLRVRYYGVSAQGGPLPHDANRLKEITMPSQRIEVTDGQNPPTHDITLPIRDLARDDD